MLGALVLVVLFLPSSMDIFGVCGRSPQAKHPSGHVVGPVEARKSRGLAEYEGIKECMLAGYCKGQGDVEFKAIAS